MGYSSETQSHKISFAHNLFLSYEIILKFCTEHESDTAVLCAKSQNYFTILLDIIDGWDFVGFAFKMSFTGISCIAMPPRGP